MIEARGHALDRMRVVADLLPPVHRAGFECRLAPDDDRVDLQQGIVPSSWEPAAVAALAEQFAQRGDEDARCAWARVRQFCEGWQDPARQLCEQVNELWLELDVAAPDEMLRSVSHVTVSRSMRYSVPRITVRFGLSRQA